MAWLDCTEGVALRDEVTAIWLRDVDGTMTGSRTPMSAGMSLREPQERRLASAFD